MPLCETGMRTKDKVYNVILSLIYLTLYDSGGDGCTSQQSKSIDPYPPVHYKMSTTVQDVIKKMKKGSPPSLELLLSLGNLLPQTCNVD
jgi:hypothetical protein